MPAAYCCPLPQDISNGDMSIILKLGELERMVLWQAGVAGAVRCGAVPCRAVPCRAVRCGTAAQHAAGLEVVGGVAEVPKGPAAEDSQLMVICCFCCAGCFGVLWCR